jgi:hypothetical protein
MARHSFDAQYLACKTPQYGLKTVPNSQDKEFTVEYRQLKPDQYDALSKATKDMPNTKRTDDGNIQVHVKTPDELSKCNKYAAQYLHEDKALRFTKSNTKDFNDDLKALFGKNKAVDFGAAKKNSTGMSM